MQREAILRQMRELAERGVDCRACQGECCTFKSNSMQITEREALDILNDLRGRGLWSQDLKAKILSSIREFRLDVEIPSFGSRANLRRTYTCPLYQPGPKGCMVQAEKKPAGCLAFNPVRAGATGLHSGCRSDQVLLENCVGEEVAEKAPIPVMLLRVWSSEGIGPADL